MTHYPSMAFPSALQPLQHSVQQLIQVAHNVCLGQAPPSVPLPLSSLNPIPPPPIQVVPKAISSSPFLLHQQASTPVIIAPPNSQFPLTTGVLHPSSTLSQIAQAAHLQHPSLTTVSSTILSFTEKARVKIRSLQERRSNGRVVCFRCGDQGHLASSCRNSVVCFSCGRLGHRSHHCKSIIIFQPPPPQPSPSALAIANKLLVLKFYSNPINKKFRETIRSSLVFHDVQDLGPIFIQTHLQK
jgi:Zinc knuckle